MYLNCGLRVYFGEEGNKIILLLIGGDKKTQSRVRFDESVNLSKHKGGNP